MRSEESCGLWTKPCRRFLVELQEHRLNHVLRIGYPPRLVERDAVHHVGVVVDDLSVLAIVHRFPSRPKGKAPTPQPLACRPVTAFRKRPFTDNTLESGEMCDAWERFWDCENQPKTAAALPWSSARRRRGGRPPQRRRDWCSSAAARTFGWSASLSPIAQPTPPGSSCTARAGASVVSATRRPSERLPTRPPAAQRRRSRGSPRRRRSPSGRAGRRRPPSPVRSRRFRLGSDGR